MKKKEDKKADKKGENEKEKKGNKEKGKEKEEAEVKKEDVLEKLKECIDPEIGLSVIDLGLVYDIKIQKDKVVLTMTMTTPTCPFAYMIFNEVESKLREIKGVKDVKINLTFNPPWSPERMSKEARSKFNL